MTRAALGGLNVLRILLVASSDTSSTLDEVYGLASAAVGRGHEVTVFFHVGGIGLLVAPRASDRLASLVPLGVRLLACRTSARERGVDSEDGLVEGAVMSSLGELVDLLDRCDRALFLG